MGDKIVPIVNYTDEEIEIIELKKSLEAANLKVKALEEQLKQFTQPKSTKSHEEKVYLFLYQVSIDGEEHHIYEIVTGRTDAYESMKAMVGTNDVDIHNSYAIVEGRSIEKMISIYEFAKAMEPLFKDNFDIEDYNTDDDDSQDQDVNENVNTNYPEPIVGDEEFAPTGSFAQYMIQEAQADDE